MNPHININEGGVSLLYTFNNNIKLKSNLHEFDLTTKQLTVFVVH